MPQQPQQQLGMSLGGEYYAPPASVNRRYVSGWGDEAGAAASSQPPEQQAGGYAGAGVDASVLMPQMPMGGF
jgi:hypothetical protein